MPKKPLPTLVLETLFVRDHQRRLRLVIDLLEQELHRQHTPTQQANAQMLNQTPRALSVANTNSGGHRT